MRFSKSFPHTEELTSLETTEAVIVPGNYNSVTLIGMYPHYTFPVIIGPHCQDCLLQVQVLVAAKCPIYT